MKSNREVKPGTMYTPSESACELTFGVIKEAVCAAKSGDRDAAQFLVAHDGAELWIRALGIGVTNEMRGMLKRMAIGGE